MYSICVDSILDFQEMTVQKTGKQPKKSADFLRCFEVLNTVISWKSKIKFTHLEYI